MKLEETILNLKTMLPAEDFIVTGSFVLAKYGLVSWDNVADLDIILVKPKASTIEMLNNFMKDFPAPSTAKLQALPVPKEETPVPEEKQISYEKRDPNRIYLDDEDDDNHNLKTKKGYKAAKAQTKSILQAIFIFGKVKIDIFIEDGFAEPTLNVDGIKYTTIPHIIAAKKSYGRMKDWLQCKDMARIIFDSAEFNNLINSDWRSMLRSDYPDK